MGRPNTLIANSEPIRFSSVALMKNAIKKLFDWTPSDVLAWEKIRKQGFWHFVLRYGVITFGMILFFLTGGITFISWILEPDSMVSLLFQLAFSACVCLLGGLITGLLTWWMEDGIYQRIMKFRSL
jgi:hypothetical protein